MKYSSYSLLIVVQTYLDKKVSKSSAVAEMGDRGHNRHGPKIGAVPVFGVGKVDLHVTQCGLGRGLPPSKWYLDPSSRLATINMGQKWGRLCPFLDGWSWVPIQHTVVWAEAYLHTNWYLDPSSRLATTDMYRKLGVVSLMGAAQSPSSTVWPGLRRISMTPSGILVYLAVWSQ